jgi:hypothetical protein
MRQLSRRATFPPISRAHCHELVSANAQADRLRASEAEVKRDGGDFDAESIDAARAALVRLFERFELRMPPDGEGRGQIKGRIREDAIEYVKVPEEEDGASGQGSRPGYIPRLRREPLAVADNHFSSW